MNKKTKFKIGDMVYSGESKNKKICEITEVQKLPNSRHDLYKLRDPKTGRNYVGSFQTAHLSIKK